MPCEWISHTESGSIVGTYPVGKCVPLGPEASFKGDCPDTVQVWKAANCDGTAMTDAEILALTGTSRTDFEAMIKFNDCGQGNCDFMSSGTPAAGQSCDGAGTTWVPTVLYQCLKTGNDTSVRYENCANGVVDVKEYSGSADCYSGLSTTNSTAKGTCAVCDLSKVEGGGDGGSPTAAPVSSSMPRFKGLTSTGLLAMVAIALAMM